MKKEALENESFVSSHAVYLPIQQVYLTCVALKAQASLVMHSSICCSNVHCYPERTEVDSPVDTKLDSAIN